MAKEFGIVGVGPSIRELIHIYLTSDFDDMVITDDEIDKKIIEGREKENEAIARDLAGNIDDFTKWGE